MTTRTTIKNKDVTLPLTKSGSGQQLVFFNGGGATQISWKKTLKQLKGHYETITFDFRSHGKASSSTDHSFAAFLSDAEAVMKEAAKGKPIIIGWSLGADVALAYAEKHSKEVGGLILVDGAAPISEPIIENEASMRQSLKSPIVRISLFFMQFTPYRYNIKGDDYADIVVELDTRRQQLVDVYKKLTCPILMIMATKSIGTVGSHAERGNRIWHDAAERVRKIRPNTDIHWIDDTHALPFKHSHELASLIDDFAGELTN